MDKQYDDTRNRAVHSVSSACHVLPYTYRPNNISRDGAPRYVSARDNVGEVRRGFMLNALSTPSTNVYLHYVIRQYVYHLLDEQYSREPTASKYFGSIFYFNMYIEKCVGVNMVGSFMIAGASERCITIYRKRSIHPIASVSNIHCLHDRYAISVPNTSGKRYFGMVCVHRTLRQQYTRDHLAIPL